MSEQANNRRGAGWLGVGTLTAAEVNALSAAHGQGPWTESNRERAARGGFDHGGRPIEHVDRERERRGLAVGDGEVMATNPLSEIKGLLDAHAGPAPQPGDYVAYLDESDPSAGVGLYRANGAPVVEMSTATYEAFMAHPTVMVATDPGGRP